jgi:hypothetical protein
MAPLKTLELANIHGTLSTFLHGQFCILDMRDAYL